MAISPDFISIGGNRNPAAADWDQDGSQLLAFGADNCIALWKPSDERLRGVTGMLNGHTDVVNVVKFFPTGSSNTTVLLSGAADHSLRIWRGQENSQRKFELVKTITEHKSPITRIATLPGSTTFATGASDGVVNIWKLVHNTDFTTIDVELIQSMSLSPRYFPLALALAKLDDTSLVLGVGGTRSTIQIFVSKDTQFQLSATLTGHEGWIRALDFTRETSDENSDILLASASQDKYIRLWRVHQGEELPAVSSALNDPALGVLGKSLSNKAHRFASATEKYSVTFEALLLGHEDWIYTASWRHRNGKLQLLSTSEDNSLAIWEADPSSGVWVCITRLGEISAQKGSTSATGSAGGFWIGLWSPDGDSVASLGRTGSWRRWTYSPTEDMWTQQVAITGHVREVKDLTWSTDGTYLLSTGSDQTTRLFAEWKRNSASSWHEFSRPQIHGYDLNCISSITPRQFISGADEKLLRVFDEPKGVAEMLTKLCAVDHTAADLPDAANIPVLGLSNKAIPAVDESSAQNGDNDEEDVDPASVARKSSLELNHPPFEDHLARHLLWPETEKLYGHGYEISAVAVSPSGSQVATACRASSIDHAVIRLYDTREWLEIKPPLKAHALTVTGMMFSGDEKWLLSVGRDRQWVVWERGYGEEGYVLKHQNLKGHSRMILGAAWTTLGMPTFLTAGRDKTVKIWQIADDAVAMKASISANAAVTAVACSPQPLDGKLLFAFGTEGGEVVVCTAEVDSLHKISTSAVEKEMGPAKGVNRIVWRPRGERRQIAVASEDCSVRVYNVE